MRKRHLLLLILLLLSEPILAKESVALSSHIKSDNFFDTNYTAILTSASYTHYFDSAFTTLNARTTNDNASHYESLTALLGTRFRKNYYIYGFISQLGFNYLIEPEKIPQLPSASPVNFSSDKALELGLGVEKVINLSPGWYSNLSLSAANMRHSHLKMQSDTEGQYPYFTGEDIKASMTHYNLTAKFIHSLSKDLYLSMDLQYQYIRFKNGNIATFYANSTTSNTGYIDMNYVIKAYVGGLTLLYSW